MSRVLPTDGCHSADRRAQRIQSPLLTQKESQKCLRQQQFRGHRVGLALEAAEAGTVVGGRIRMVSKFPLAGEALLHVHHSPGAAGGLVPALPTGLIEHSEEQPGCLHNFLDHDHTCFVPAATEGCGCCMPAFLRHALGAKPYTQL